jgi:hypothetical protein
VRPAWLRSYAHVLDGFSSVILNVQTLGLGFAVTSLWKPWFTPVSLVRDARKIGS